MYSVCTTVGDPFLLHFMKNVQNGFSPIMYEKSLAGRRRHSYVHPVPCMSEHHLQKSREWCGGRRVLPDDEIGQNETSCKITVDYDFALD
jgi:hypothetical protein